MSTDVFSSADRFGQRDGETSTAPFAKAATCRRGKAPKGRDAILRSPRTKNLQASAYPVYVVVNGLRGMPGFATYLDDEQVARIVTYIRTHFGNDYRGPGQPRRC